MRELEFSKEMVDVLEFDRVNHPHPVVRQRMAAVWAWSQKFDQKDCARISGVSQRTVRRYLDGFENGGIDWLRELRWMGHDGRLHAHTSTLEVEFSQNPPRTAAEARSRIESLCGVSIGLTQVRVFLRAHGFKWRKIAAIPIPPKKHQKST